MFFPEGLTTLLAPLYLLSVLKKNGLQDSLVTQITFHGNDLLKHNNGFNALLEDTSEDRYRVC